MGFTGFTMFYHVLPGFLVSLPKKTMFCFHVLPNTMGFTMGLLEKSYEHHKSDQILPKQTKQWFDLEYMVSWRQ